LEKYRIEAAMKFLKKEDYVEYNGNIFKRIFEKGRPVKWYLFQSTAEAELWSSMSEEASKNLNKEYEQMKYMEQ
jgi:predicted transcriptional regulator